MLFNSDTFLIFFAIAYSLYLAARNHKSVQNRLLLGASYVFYAAWDWRFVSLLLISTFVDFFVGRKIGKSDRQPFRRAMVAISIATNLSILGFFKYFNFFSDSLVAFLNAFGFQPDYPTMTIILPIGISFYTFQSLSYTIDVYRRRIAHVDQPLDFALYVAFFPQLVAGPIERVYRLVPQIQQARRISPEQVQAGIFLILWGYIKKVMIADNVAPIADAVFGNYQNYQGIDILIGVFAFTLQIYCDFSGYSDIARGIAKLMGFDLVVNFRLPYFARNPRDFWRRWHISLSTWLRDYLYVSLGGNRRRSWLIYRNLALTMLLGGLWHGAAWNFIIWGSYHGLLLCVHRYFSVDRSVSFLHWVVPGIRRSINVTVMFLLTMLGWLIFRSESVPQIAAMLGSISLEFSARSMQMGYEVIFFAFPLILVQIWQLHSGDLLAFTRCRPFIQAVFLAVGVAATLIFNTGESVEFIYFQF